MKSMLMLLSLLGVVACRTHVPPENTAGVQAGAGFKAGGLTPADAQTAGRSAGGGYVGFDRNLYPGDDRLAELHVSFTFAGFWLNSPPGETANTWAGKRAALRDAGFGFLVLANGRLDAEIRHAKLTPEALGRQDAEQAVGAAAREGFPQRTLIFLDQEEGGRLLPEQAAYLFAWTEAVAGSRYRAGAYLSGQASPDGTAQDGKLMTITTAQDVREHIAGEHLHPVVLWVQQDACPPAPGCTLAAPRLADSGTADAAVWQYAQTPRRRELTRACASSYAADESCYVGVTRDLFVDLDVADEPDPSHGR